MSKTSHAAVRAPQEAERPKATLSQLGELIALMNVDKIERDYMQDFLRRRLVKRSATPIVSEPVPENTLLAKVEEMARIHYPHAVSDILELVVPFCDPQLDLEFKVGKADLDVHGHVQHALECFGLHVVETIFIDVAVVRPHVTKFREIFPDNDLPLKFLIEIVDEMFGDVFQTFRHLDPTCEKGARAIVEESGLSRHMRSRLEATGAAKYNLLGPIERHFVRATARALEKAIVLAARNDQVRLAQVVQFLTHQRSGRPVVVCSKENKTMTAYVLVAPEKTILAE